MRTASQTIAAINAQAAFGTVSAAANGAPTLFMDFSTGSLVGTVALQARPAGSSAAMWQNVGTPLTANGLINPGIIYGDMEFRVFCSAFTSGSGAGVFQVTA